MQHKVVSSPALYPQIEVYPRSTKVLDTHINLEWLLNHFKITMRYNRMSRRREIVIPHYQAAEDDKENNQLYWIEHLATINGMPVRNVDKHLDLLCSMNGYHPIVDALKNIKWDGVDRLTDFLNTLTTTDPTLDKIMIATWLRAAIAAAHSVTGFANHGVLVLQGEQGLGKTAWARRLDPIDCGAVKPDANVEPKNKDSIIGLARFWIAEIGELDGTFNKSDIAHLKGFITSSVDDVRVPWGKRESRLIRRSAFIATVNNPEFLIDTTGNRRWWTVSVTKIDYEHKIDMLQLWAQVKVDWEAGGLTYLPNDLQQQLNIKNEDFEVIDPIHEAICTKYDWTTKERRRLTATDVLTECGYEKPDMKQASRAGRALTRVTGQKSKRYNGSKVHLVPPLLINSNLRY